MSTEIRARLDALPLWNDAGRMPMRDALRAVLDLCDAAPATLPAHHLTAGIRRAIDAALGEA